MQDNEDRESEILIDLLERINTMSNEEYIKLYEEYVEEYGSLFDIDFEEE